MENQIKDFLNDYPVKDLDTVEGSKGLCDSVSVALKKYLNSLGIQAVIIEGIGYKPKLHESAHSDWQVFKGKDQKFLAHVVVKVNDLIIDLTGAQFNIENEKRVIYSFSTFKKEWKTIKSPIALNKK